MVTKDVTYMTSDRFPAVVEKMSKYLLTMTSINTYLCRFSKEFFTTAAMKQELS